VAPTDGGRGSSPASEGEFEEQRALQESLANLLVLGKRAPSSEDSPEAARPGKRTRQLTKAKVHSSSSSAVRLLIARTDNCARARLGAPEPAIVRDVRGHEREPLGQARH
jgi:hypothetical protein